MPQGPSLRAGVSADGDLLSAEGDWTAAHAADLDRLAHAARPSVRKLTINLEGVGRLDTFGVWALERLRRSVLEAGAQADIAIPRDARADLFAGVEKALARPCGPGGRRDRWGTLLQRMGCSAEAFALDFAAFLDLTGRLTVCFARGLRHPARLRLRSAVHHLDRTGLRAVPIIALMCFLIGCILAQQGFFHFQRFGAMDYVVDLVTILVLREIGVLLVTIMVAGRSGSAYTAEIGSIKDISEADLRDQALAAVESALAGAAPKTVIVRAPKLVNIVL